MSDNALKVRTNREIRSYARERLLGNMLIPCLVTFFFFSARNVFEVLMQLGFLGNDMFAFFFYIALFITINSIWGLLRYGISRYFLSFITTKKASPANIFAGFKGSTETIIGISLILAIISLISQLPYIIYTFFFSVNTSHSFLLSLILFLAGNLVVYLIEAYLAPVYFVICDNPSTKLTWVMIITFSLMNKKNFFKYIGLQISFVPLYLLGLLSLGIGLLWVVPYAYTSYAYFYETLNEEFLLKQSVKEETSEQ